MNYRQRYEDWLKITDLDDELRGELISIKDNEKEIEERFYKALEFGTAGIRGIIGAGDNRMNIYTVGKATQGLANYINKQSEEAVKRGVVIAYDSRRMSPEFSKFTATVLAGNGIKVYMFDNLRPTPMLSFAVRYLNCISGIVITASHNPPEYNGYKVYWEDGAQLTVPHDVNLINEVNNVKRYEETIKIDFNKAINSNMIEIIGERVDEAYYKEVLNQREDLDLIEEMKDKLNIVYTPVHGTGNIPVREILKGAGYKNVYIVKEQELPDENFRSVDYPNPEDPKVFRLGIELGKEIGADIILGTDPDGDRVGVAVKNRLEEYEILSGNIMGILLTEYILMSRKNKGILSKNDCVISTIVSTKLTKAICKAYDVRYEEVLTGFKYIGRKIKDFIENDTYNFVFGFEESNGSLKGTYARDKDAVVATLMLSELAAYYKRRGKTLLDGIEEIYKKYGYYRESIEPISFQGKEGIEKIQDIVEYIRENPIREINGIRIMEYGDYEKEEIMINNRKYPTNLPKSNVLYYVLEDESYFYIRPSGTEPKIKIYFGTKGIDASAADEKLLKLKDGVLKIIK